jgi:hypothetical protein
MTAFHRTSLAPVVVVVVVVVVWWLVTRAHRSLQVLYLGRAGVQSTGAALPARMGRGLVQHLSAKAANESHQRDPPI